MKFYCFLISIIAITLPSVAFSLNLTINNTTNSAISTYYASGCSYKIPAAIPKGISKYYVPTPCQFTIGYLNIGIISKYEWRKSCGALWCDYAANYYAGNLTISG